MHLWLYKGQALPGYIHLYLQVSSPSCHDLQSQNHPHKTKNLSEKCDSLSLYLSCVCTVSAHFQLKSGIFLGFNHNLVCLPKDYLIRQLGNVPLSRHYVFDVTNILHLTSTSSGRDQFDLIIFKRDNSEVADILGIKSTSAMVLNYYCIAFSQVMGKLFG